MSSTNERSGVRDRLIQAARTVESGSERVAESGGSVTAPPSRERASEPEVTPEIRRQVKSVLTLADSSIRQALGAPQREGVDLEAAPADRLDFAAEMIAPLAAKHETMLSPEVRAGIGGAVLVLDIAADANLMEPHEDGPEPEDRGPISEEEFTA